MAMLKAPRWPCRVCVLLTVFATFVFFTPTLIHSQLLFSCTSSYTIQEERGGGIRPMPCVGFCFASRLLADYPERSRLIYRLSRIQVMVAVIVMVYVCHLLACGWYWVRPPLSSLVDVFQTA